MEADCKSILGQKYKCIHTNQRWCSVKSMVKWFFRCRPIKGVRSFSHQKPPDERWWRFLLTSHLSASGIPLQEISYVIFFKSLEQISYSKLQGRHWFYAVARKVKYEKSRFYYLCYFCFFYIQILSISCDEVKFIYYLLKKYTRSQMHFLILQSFLSYTLSEYVK